MNQRPAEFVDVQVNGYAGTDFNDLELSAESLHAACGQLQADGVNGILATIITDDLDRMARKLKRIVELRSRDPLAEQLIWGVHIEGPFISPKSGFVGTHPVRCTRPADESAMQQLLEAADGLTRIVTLAPECDPNLQVTRMLAQQGVCVAAGHCDPGLDDLHAAIDAGLGMFTHLGNGCPLMMPRHDNVIQRVLSCADRLSISFIADGVHVPWHVLGNFIRCAGIERCLVVTDAISAAGLGPGQFKLGDRDVLVDNDGATWSADKTHLCGSATTMEQSAGRLASELMFSAEEIRRLTSENPRRLCRHAQV